uniref:Plant heme peroxidase family profile domain-containing protein n=1 Tax=Ananas comosus var. bracteatus TaxID=296719 RepID=A0A6V7PF93_ANACO|nr:unnamed protein product [Ananas comosus var. bracteatus]
MASKTLLVLLLPFNLVLFLSILAEAQLLQVGFYSKTCPNVEDIVRKEMTEILSVAPSLAGPLLRLHFHDCFVRGCDGSVLLDSTKNNVAEKDADPNKSLRDSGDAVWLSKGPSWPVWTGRRDGRVKGLSVKDLAVLSGGHTLGTSHCSSFSERLYNFTGKDNLHDVDPALDKEYVPKLRARCSLTDNTTIVEMDPGSFRTFDTSYYKYVAKRRGLFHSDASLLTYSETKAYVQRHADGLTAEFFQDFGDSMINMGMLQS